MPSAAFWSALGQALLSGGQALHTATEEDKRDKLVAQERADRLAQDAIQNRFAERQFDAGERDREDIRKARNLGILQKAIEGANPDEPLPDSIVKQTQGTPLEAILSKRAMPSAITAPGGQFDFSKVGTPETSIDVPAMVAKAPGGTPIPQAAKTLPAQVGQGQVGAPVEGTTNPLNSFGFFRQQTPEEQLSRTEAGLKLQATQNLLHRAQTGGQPGGQGGFNDRALTSLAFGPSFTNSVYGPAQQDPFAGTGGLSGDELLKTLSPGEAAAVKKVANYDLALPTSGRLNNAQLRLIALASQYDPSFDQKQYQTRQKVQNSFTSGKDKDNLVSLNTAIAHLGTMATKASDLGNVSGFGSPQINAVKNAFGQHVMGQGEVPGFMQAAHAVAGEMSKVFKGTSGTDQEIKDWEAGLSPNMTPEAQSAAINSLVDLLKGRMEVLKSTYENGMGKSFGFSFLNDKSKQTLAALGFDPGALDPYGDKPSFQVPGTKDEKPATQAPQPKQQPNPNGRGGGAGSMTPNSATVGDITNHFVQQYGRQPSQQELLAAIKAIRASGVSVKQ